MMAASSLIAELRGSIPDESARIQREFEATGDGRACVTQRTRMVESILARLWRDIVSSDESKPANISLVATGGFGREWLFPFSDIDLLFLFGDRDAVIIADIPSNEAAAALSMAVNATGALRTRTTPLLTLEEIDAAAKDEIHVHYRAPGT